VPASARPTRSLSIALLVASLGSLSAACSPTPAGASDANLAQAKSRAAQGSALFEKSCAVCHGPRGEGLAGAPLIIGANALPRYPRDQSGVQLYQDPNQVQRQNQQRVPGMASRIEFVTAQNLLDYLELHVTQVKKPAGAPDLNEGDLWSIVNFVLIAHGSEIPTGEITPDNADSVQIRAQ
jgi:cytochrome c5